MDILHITDEKVTLLDHLSEVPGEGFVWLDCIREVDTNWADEVARLLELHKEPSKKGAQLQARLLFLQNLSENVVGDYAYEEHVHDKHEHEQRGLHHYSQYVANHPIHLLSNKKPTAKISVRIDKIIVAKILHD